MGPSFLAAVDVGAESGRVVLGRWDGLRFAETVVHRFANQAVRVDGTLRWDPASLVVGMLHGLAQAVTLAKEAGGRLSAIGITTWGVDYVLLDAAGTALEQPWHYRDARTAGTKELVAARIPDAELWTRTGTAALPFNTVYQLVASERDRPGLLAAARQLVTIPDWLRGVLAGQWINEWTNAATTGLTQAGRCAWDRELLARLDLPAHLFKPLLPAGQVLAAVQPEIATRLGCADRPPLVVITPGHDTAAAVAAVPGDAAAGVFISCGTWSLLGRLEDRPHLEPAVQAAGFSNEIAHDGRVRLLRNIMGLWVLQECRRGFAGEGRDLDYATLATLTAAEAPGQPLDIDDPRFFPPGTPEDPMHRRVQAWYVERNLPVPASDGAIARRVIEGLAESYRRAIADLARITGRPISTLHLLGGGCQNTLLCQLTADATGLRVVAGPAEATALGTLLVQGAALGWFPMARLPAIAERSGGLVTYEPSHRRQVAGG